MNLSSKALADNVCRLRYSKGLSQRELADVASISLYTMRQIEGGDYEGSVAPLWEIAGVLGVKLLDLFEPVRPLKHVHFTYHEGDDLELGEVNDPD